MTVILDGLSLPAMAKPWQQTVDYFAYVAAQIEKTQRFQKVIAGGPRVTNLVGHLVRSDRRSPLERSVLCVGCRNTHELCVLHAAGFGPVLGIDLVSTAPSIYAMDMHATKFPNGMFDVIFACHSLEHAYDVDVVLKEWARITVPGGTWVIEVPIKFPTTAVDRQDLGSLDALQARVAPWTGRILFADAGRGVARLIVQTKES